MADEGNRKNRLGKRGDEKTGLNTLESLYHEHADWK